MICVFVWFSVALLFQAIPTLMYLTTVKVHSLITYTTFIEATAVLMSIAALLYLRRAQPKLERPIKVSGLQII